jgi:hypothetical protein
MRPYCGHFQVHVQFGSLNHFKKYLFQLAIANHVDYHVLGEFIPSYILHTRAFGTYLLGGGVIYLAKKIIR